jgi:L-ascorbate metabolism protein UlaG (beta-lactamase superfamily)
VLLDLDGVRLLTDPLLRDRASYLRRQVPVVDPVEYAGIDAVLVSHLHPDHLDLPSLERLGREMPTVVPRGGVRLLARRGFRRVAEVEAGEEVRIGALRVRATHAEHGAAQLPFRPRVPALGYLIAGSRRVYFAGDTGIFGGMANIDRALDVALVPVGGWGPLAPFWERFPSAVPGHLDPRRGAVALQLLRPLLAVPIHWGIYTPLGLGHAMLASRNQPPRAFRRNADKLAPEVEVRVLNPGETLRLDPVAGT